jgi:hypothetical protein
MIRITRYRFARREELRSNCLSEDRQVATLSGSGLPMVRATDHKKSLVSQYKPRRVEYT